MYNKILFNRYRIYDPLSACFILGTYCMSGLISARVQYKKVASTKIQTQKYLTDLFNIYYDRWSFFCLKLFFVEIFVLSKNQTKVFRTKNFWTKKRLPIFDKSHSGLGAHVHGWYISEHQRTSLSLELRLKIYIKITQS